MKLTLSGFCGRTWLNLVTLVMIGGSLGLTSGCASGPREWVSSIIPKWGSDPEGEKKEVAKSDKSKAKQSAKTKEAVDALAQNSERAKGAKDKAKAKEELAANENQSSKSKTFKPGDPRSQVATSTKVRGKEKEAADKEKETASARKPASKDKPSEDVIADRLSKSSDKAIGGRVRGVMAADDPYGSSVAKTDKPASKKKSDADPFADDTEVASTKSAKKDIRVPTAKKTADIKPSEDPAILDEIDREMAAMGLEKKPTAKKPRAPESETVSTDRLKELLSEDRESENVVAATKGKSRTVSHEEQAENPFAEFEKRGADPKVEAAAVKKTVKAAPKAENDELLEDMFEEKGGASAKTAGKSAVKKAKNDNRDLPHLNDADSQEALPPGADAVDEPADPKAAKAKKKAATPQDQAEDLKIQALAAFRKNKVEEACTLLQSAVELEKEHDLVFEEGESPSSLLKRLNQLQGGSTKKAGAPAAKAAEKAAPPAEESLPALSPEVQPIEDERQGSHDPFKPEKKIAGKTGEGSQTRTASLEQTDLSQGGISRVSANHPVTLPPLPTDKPGAKLSKVDDKACASKCAAEDPFLADGEAPRELATAREEYKHESATAHASVTDDAVAAPSLKRRSNTAALILTGVSLVSLGLSGLILWRHMQNKQTVTLANRPVTQADKIHAHKS